jgi:hypothetical protein
LIWRWKIKQAEDRNLLFSVCKKCAIIGVGGCCFAEDREIIVPNLYVATFCSVALQMLQALQNATRLIVSDLSADKILLLTKCCQHFSLQKEIFM